MEKQLKCVLKMLSLEELALRRVAIGLWSDSNILASISKFRLFGFSTLERKKDWQEIIEDKIKDKMLQLELPASIMKELIDIVRPISLDIRRWKIVYQGYFFASNEEIGLPDSAKLCFTSAGSVDYRRTAEELVRCKALGVVRRYKIACLHCLEDYIPLLWEELPEERREFFCNKKFTSPYLEFCWPHILKGEHSKLDYLLTASNRNLTTFNQCAFEFLAERRCKTAAEYFFQKLTHEEKGASLMRTAHALLANSSMENLPEETLSDALCYLLSVMTPEQQTEIVKAQPIKVLLCFLDWQWQDLFLENADLIWTFLPPRAYRDLLKKMINIYSDFYFPKLFQEFFIQSPLDFKKCLVDPKSAFPFLSIFFESEDSESIEVIFRNVDGADRVKLVFHPSVLKFFYESILIDRWHMVEVCLREAKLSKEDGERLKKAFLKCNGIGRIEWENRKLKRFFDFLDETNESADKEKKAQKRKLENCCAE
ncbi:hypothetical protein AVEN_50175-1 [Araneus ventricosus]|uniref:Uncharacterized protein n=1 Tax=Araneus ventricosus TaxID=182803 RepID=A0A4Y2UGD4_ARAVE|nr:hypothetical protein AVEN_50175-1 [Araneus ventricosus]